MRSIYGSQARCGLLGCRGWAGHVPGTGRGACVQPEGMTGCLAGMAAVGQQARWTHGPCKRHKYPPQQTLPVPLSVFMPRLRGRALWSLAALCAAIISMWTAFLKHAGMSALSLPYTPQGVLLIIAHPDDESMFFAPTLISLHQHGVPLYVLCLSNGVCRLWPNAASDRTIFGMCMGVDAFDGPPPCRRCGRPWTNPGAGAVHGMRAVRYNPAECLGSGRPRPAGQGALCCLACILS
jgi:GlcNAc-PI de-N-acetylase